MSYAWEESPKGNTWAPINDGGNYSGVTTNRLSVANVNIEGAARQVYHFSIIKAIQ